MKSRPCIHTARSLRARAACFENEDAPGPNPLPSPPADRRPQARCAGCKPCSSPECRPPAETRSCPTPPAWQRRPGCLDSKSRVRCHRNIWVRSNSLPFSGLSGVTVAGSGRRGSSRGTTSSPCPIFGSDFQMSRAWSRAQLDNSSAVAGRSPNGLTNREGIKIPGVEGPP